MVTFKFETDPVRWRKGRGQQMAYAGGAGAEAPMTDASQTGARDRLPRFLTVPLIGGLSAGLWVCIWLLVRLALGG